MMWLSYPEVVALGWVIVAVVGGAVAFERL